MKTATNLKKITLLAGDIAVFYASLFLTLVARYQNLPDYGLWWLHFWPFSYIFLIWILFFYVANLYDLRIAANNSRFWQLLGRSLAIASFFALAFFYLTPQIIAPKTNLLIYLVIFSILFSLWREFYNWLLAAYLPKNNLAIIGLNNETKELVLELKKAHLGYHVAFIADNGQETYFDDIKIASDFKTLPQLVRENRIDIIVISPNQSESDDLRNQLFACLPLKVNFVSLPIFYETITGKVPVNVINHTWFLENLSEGGKTGFDAFKRTYDLVLAFFAIIITTPFWPIIASIIRLESKGPVFFIQTRLGKNGEPFKIYKFRTMREECNDRSMTSENDCRITRFGNFLRKSRIDEIPQIINILKGEMSFVGPRPERPELVEELERIIPFYRERMLVKPGVTGWDQVSGEYHSPTREDTLKKLQYDLFYIKNRSIYLELSIILKTIYTVLSRSGR